MILSALLAAVLAAPTDNVVFPVSRPVQDPPPTTPEWKGTLALGANWTDGNTETEGLTGSFNAERRAEDERWTLDAYSNYGSTTDTVTDEKDITTNNHGAGAKYDYFLTDKSYLFGNGSGKVDHVAELDLRTILGAGIGHQWTETEKLKWGTDVGLSWVDEDFEDNEFDESFLAARLGSNLAYQISKSAAFEQVAEVLPSLEDNEDLIARVDNRLKLNITGKWIAQIQYVLDFDGSVPTGEDPGPDGKEEADHRVILSVGWTFGPEPTTP